MKALRHKCFLGFGAFFGLHLLFKYSATKTPRPEEKKLSPFVAEFKGLDGHEDTKT